MLAARPHFAGLLYLPHGQWVRKMEGRTYIASSVVGKVQAAISLLDEVLDDRFALGQVLGVHKFG